MKSDGGTRPQWTIFIPAYNEARNLPRCLAQVTAETARLGLTVEFLIVNDASRDDTGALAEALARADPRIRVIHHARNRGIGGAFVTAVQSARGEWLILIPADLPLHISELHKYLEASATADIVVGLRSDRSDYSWARRLVSQVNIALIRRLFGMTERQFQYISLYRLDVLRAFEIEFWRSAFFLAEVLIKAKRLGYRLTEVEINYAPRLTGKATGGKLWLIVLTVFEMFRFWLRWVRCGPDRAVRPRAPAQQMQEVKT